MRHPLLPTPRCVPNHIALGANLSALETPTEAAQAYVVSGSNMSGKSTYLRTAGIQVVMALAGSVVPAESLTLTPLAVGCSIRIQDSLQDGASRFYAEITRLRTVLDLTDGDLPACFLLDEILHGTNSHDRRIGAEAVVRTLLDRDAIGLVTTHDLALAEIADTEELQLRNVHFEDEVIDGKIVFDHKLHDGVVTHSNALALMREVGLELADTKTSGT